MGTKTRRQFSGAQKVAILKRHLVDREAISDICDEVRINPNMFYRWQKTFFENGAKAFEPNDSRRREPQARRVADLEQKITEKDGVISELATELIKSKKNNGVP